MSGSDEKINYQIRPAKSIQRKMVCSLIREIQIKGGLQDFRYIGMGAKYFSDFVLLHNQFGTTNMISLESEEEKKEKYEFNKPLGFIKIEYGYSYNLLPQLIDWDKQDNLVWLDYDDAISAKVFDDMQTVVLNCHSGDMLIVTINASIGGENQSKKKEQLMARLGNHFDERIPLDRCTSKRLPQLESELMMNYLNELIKQKHRLHGSDLIVEQLLSIKYQDSAPMLSLGVLFMDEALKEKIDYRQLRCKFPFVSNCNEMYELKVPSLTNKEIQFILREIPLENGKYSYEAFHGITEDEIKQFESIYRYYPYYTESAFNT